MYCPNGSAYRIAFEHVETPATFRFSCFERFTVLDHHALVRVGIFEQGARESEIGLLHFHGLLFRLLALGLFTPFVGLLVLVRTRITARCSRGLRGTLWPTLIRFIFGHWLVLYPRTCRRFETSSGIVSAPSLIAFVIVRGRRRGISPSFRLPIRTRIMMGRR
jgi:hypothetical protein